MPLAYQMAALFLQRIADGVASLPLALRLYMPLDELMRSSAVTYELTCFVQAARYLAATCAVTRLLGSRFRDVRILVEARATSADRFDGRRTVFVRTLSAAAKVWGTFALRNIILHASTAYCWRALDYSRPLPLSLLLSPTGIVYAPALAMRGLHTVGMAFFGLYGPRGAVQLLADVCSRANAASVAAGFTSLPRPLCTDHLLDGFLFSYLFVFSRPYGVSRWFRLSETTTSGGTGDDGLANASRITSAAFAALSVTTHDVAVISAAVHMEDYASAVITYGVAPALAGAWRRFTDSRRQRQQSGVGGGSVAGAGASPNSSYSSSSSPTSPASPTLQPSIAAYPRWEFNAERWAVRLASRLIADLLIVAPLAARLFGPRRAVISFTFPLPAAVSSSGGLPVTIPTAFVAAMLFKGIGFNAVAPFLEGCYSRIRGRSVDTRGTIAIIDVIRSGALPAEAARVITEALGPLDSAAAGVRTAGVLSESTASAEGGSEAPALATRSANSGLDTPAEVRAATAYAKFKVLDACRRHVRALAGAEYDTMTDADAAQLYSFAAAHVLDQNPPIAPLQHSLFYLCYALRQLRTLDPSRRSRRRGLLDVAIACGAVRRLNVSGPSAPLPPMDFGGAEELSAVGSPTSPTRAAFSAVADEDELPFPLTTASGGGAADEVGGLGADPRYSSASADVCCVCLRDISDESPDVCRTHCRHLYHTACLAETLVAKGTCPLCTASLLAAPANGDGGEAAEADAEGGAASIAFIPPAAVTIANGQPCVFTLARSAYKYNMQAKRLLARAVQVGHPYARWGSDLAMIANALEGRAFVGSVIVSSLLEAEGRRLSRGQAARIGSYIDVAWGESNVFGKPVPSLLQWLYEEAVAAQSRHSFFYIQAAPISAVRW